MEPAKYSVKENESQQHAEAETSFPSKSLLQTPTRPRFQPSQFVAKTPSRTISDATIAAIRKTPMGSSKLLRERLERVASDSTATTPRHRRRRLIESGALRLEKQSNQQKQQSLQSLNTPKRFTPARRRIGYDGTPNTPSWELLSTTACFRNRQRHRPCTPKSTQLSKKSTFNRNRDDDDDDHYSIDDDDDDYDDYDIEDATATAMVGAMASMLSSSSSSSSPKLGNHNGASPSKSYYLLPSQTVIRNGCTDPVAFTLWNDGNEDMEYLLQHDQTARAPPYGADDRCESPVRERSQEMTDRCSPSSTGRHIMRMSGSPAEPTNALVFHSHLARPVPKRLSH